MEWAAAGGWVTEAKEGGEQKGGGGDRPVQGHSLTPCSALRSPSLLSPACNIAALCRLAARSEGSSIDVFLVHAAEHIDVSATDNLQQCPSKDSVSAQECVQAPTLDADAPHAQAQLLPRQQQRQQSQQQHLQQLQQMQRPRHDNKCLLSSAHAPQLELQGRAATYPSQAGPATVQVAGPLQAHVTQYVQYPGTVAVHPQPQQAGQAQAQYVGYPGSAAESLTVAAHPHPQRAGQVQAQYVELPRMSATTLHPGSAQSGGGYM